MESPALGAFTSLVFAALLIEAVINIVENLKDKETSWQYWASLVLGLVVSILVAVNWNLDLFRLAGFAEGTIPFVGPILTGILLSRGSNVLSDLIAKLNL